MIDTTKVREAAESDLWHWDNGGKQTDFGTLTDTPFIAATRLYMREHDPTPLTVEGLVETVVRAGGKCSGDDAVRIGRLTFAICEIEVIVGVLIDGKHVPPELWPRTLGELAMLLAMMEGR